ncbi:NAD(P)/FAD-dependent oxidoreductase [Salinicoccus sp. ID82-1]|uniref:dihydrolipoyl dehydrogenase family protein n=1 Tax=Salinicoccus sp. ID82-1 TaxID=2820269 RepID=UPI001F1CBB7E|nr:NAD(P)/FAD-dependent oxidoreductase [Salinicoccus sp. ID82-1]MCG1010780.1 NAD(P)/FAD-dependent oxidoreductase [Salinicoccus sp. ID82-1]
MKYDFDLIVVGTGSAATTAAMKCRDAGWEVAMIDSRPYGGTCPLRGCDPKKVLVGAAEMIDDTERMNGKGITSGTAINWSELMDFKRTFTEPVPEGKIESLKKAGIHTFHGRASFMDEETIQVEDDQLKGKHILIATGAKPVELPIEGTEHLTYSDEFLELDELPSKLIFVGGGYISFEFAHIAARAGAEVHIIQRGERPLKNFEPELVDLLVKSSEENGIQVHLNTEVKSIRKADDSFTVEGEKNGEPFELEGDCVVHGAGRVPEIDDLDLEKGNVDSEKNGVSVNEYLQSVSNPRVYAAGDAAATKGLPLTPIASMESQVVAANLLDGNQQKPDYEVMPSVVFTLPKLSAVGLSEEAAREQGYNIRVNKIDTAEWYTYKRTNEKYAMVKIIIDEDTDQVLGAHLLSREADELINHFATTIHFKLKTADLKQVTYAYPTAASDIGSML